VTKLKKDEMVGACITQGERRYACKILIGNVKGYQGTHGRIILE
jgi:hypothetical protein